MGAEIAQGACCPLPMNESFAQVRNEECWKHQTGTLLSMKPSGIALFIISVSLRRALLHFFYPLPLEGERPKGKGLAEGEIERSQPPALRATSFQRKEGEIEVSAALYILQV